MFPSVVSAFTDPPPSPSSDSSFDEDEVNYRVKPYWPAYSNVLRSRGFRLDTVRDVKEYYKLRQMRDTSDNPGWCVVQGLDDDAVCPDAGLPDNLFRGSRMSDGTKVVIKAVHRRSRELDIIRFLSSPPMRHQPMNHCIPVLDLVQVTEDDIAFIVMEEWSPQLIADDGPCCLKFFLIAIRQCIEHAVFMHRHHIAHLDISLRNLLTDYRGHYAYIDFELSRKFDELNPRIYGYRGTEIPPECNKSESCDPYKVDVWALAILILRACKLAGFCVPELVDLVKPMLHDNPDLRPPLASILPAFERMAVTISPARLQMSPDYDC